MHRVLLFLLLALGSSRCSSSDNSRVDASSISVYAAEEHFDNDPKIVFSFSKLTSCLLAQGAVDSQCLAMRTLRRRTQPEGMTAAQQEKVSKTLCHLLLSAAEKTRAAAAELLFFYRREAGVKQALVAAFLRERRPAIKAALLRQLCWVPPLLTEKEILPLLKSTQPEVLRVEAIACCAKRTVLAVPAKKQLRELLGQDPLPRIRGQACAALGKHRDGEAVKAIAALLPLPEATGPCSTALAAIGNQKSFTALRHFISAAAQAEKISAHQIAALSSFIGQPYFAATAAQDQFLALASRTDLSLEARQRAADVLLLRFDGEKALLALRNALQKLPDEKSRLLQQRYSE